MLTASLSCPSLPMNKIQKEEPSQTILKYQAMYLKDEAQVRCFKENINVGYILG